MYRSPGPYLFGAPLPPVASGPATRAHTLHTGLHGENIAAATITAYHHRWPSGIEGAIHRRPRWGVKPHGVTGGDCYNSSEGARLRDAAPRVRRRRTAGRPGLGPGPEPGAGAPGRPTVQAIPLPVWRAQAQVQERTAEEGGHGHGVGQQVSRSAIRINNNTLTQYVITHNINTIYYYYRDVIILRSRCLRK